MKQYGIGLVCSHEYVVASSGATAPFVAHILGVLCGLEMEQVEREGRMLLRVAALGVLARPIARNVRIGVTITVLVPHLSANVRVADGAGRD